MYDALLTLDGNILLWIQKYIRTGWLTAVMLPITKLGDLGKIWILICLVLLIFRKTRLAGAAGILALVFSLCVNNVLLKRMFARTRPYEVIDGLLLLTKKATDFSFPSGHAGSSFAAATAIFCMSKSKGRAAVLVFAALIAFSRLYVGIHYPTDVLAGTITGILCGLAAVRCVRCVLRKKEAAGI